MCHEKLTRITDTLYEDLCTFMIILLYWLLQPFMSLRRLTLEVSRSLTMTQPQSVGLLWTSDQPVAETST
jgi:hypothetical protein